MGKLNSTESVQNKPKALVVLTEMDISGILKCTLGNKIRSYDCENSVEHSSKTTMWRSIESFLQ